MNEIQELSQLRSEVPTGPAPAHAHDTLAAAIAAEQNGRPATGPSFWHPALGAGGPAQRARRPRRMVLAGGLALVVAGGLAGGLTAGLGGASPAASPAVAHHVTVTRAMEVTAQIATVLRAKPAFPPGQWIYYKELDVGGSQRSTQVGWETADGVHMAWYTHGQLKVHNMVALDHKVLSRQGLGPITKLDYASLSQLPTDPKKLDAYIASLYPGLSGQPLSRKVAKSIEALVAMYTPEPKIAAALYQGLAAVPGITATTNGKDLAGHPAIVLDYPRDEATVGSIYLKPHSYDWDGVSTTDASGAAGYSMLRLAFVSGPGVTP